MKRFSGFVALAVTVAGLPGCGWLWGENGYFRDRNEDYLKSEQTQPLQLPDGVESKSVDPLLPIPDYVPNLDTANVDQQEVPRPRPMAPLVGNGQYSLEKHGDERWLLARYPMSQVWAPVRQFFMANGFQIAQENANTGEFITQWQLPQQLNGSLAKRFVANDESPQEVRLRVRVQPGMAANVSEVQVAAAQRPAGSQAEPQFSATRADMTSEEGVLDGLLAGLSSTNTTAATGTNESESVSLLGSAYDAPRQARLETDGSGNLVLHLSTDFNRAWSSVGRALQRVDLRVDDLNRSTGLYYINLAQHRQEDDGGDEKQASSLLNKLFGSNEPTHTDAPDQRYQVRLTTAGDEVLVTVEQGMNNVAPHDIAEQVLTSIKTNLN